MKFYKLAILLFVFVLFFQSCNQENNSDNVIIPKDSLAMLIADIHVADATLNVIMNSEKFKDIDEYYASVLRKYNISRARFDTTLAYYTSEPEAYNEIYEDVMLILSQKEGEVFALPNEKEVKVKKDKSLRYVTYEKSDFDNKKSKNILIDKKSDLNSNSGKYSLYFEKTRRFSNKLEYQVENFDEIRLAMIYSFKLISTEINKAPVLVIEVLDKNNNQILFEKIDTYKNISTKGEWNKIDINSTFRIKEFTKKAKLRIYLSNVFNQEFFIDDLEFSIKVK